MTWIDHYLRATYQDGARGPDRYDCWGLVREVRHVIYGKRLLPSWGGVRNTQPAEFTRAYRAEAALMEECAPEVGAIAACFRGSLCLHVAVVVDIGEGLRVLEIRNAKTSARLLRLTDFERHYARVIYYRDKS